MLNAKLLETVGGPRYNGTMNETHKDIPASEIQAHDVLVGSGFLVMSAKPTGEGRIVCIGNYPLSKNQIRYFSPTAIVTVRRAA